MTQSTEFAYYTDRFVRRIHSKLHPRAFAVDKEKVGQLGGLILMALAELEPVPIQSLVSHMARDKSQMTRAIKSLETKGLIERVVFPDDRRVCLLQLTSKGHSLVKVFTSLLGDVITELLEPLSNNEKEQLLKLLRKI